MCPLAGVKRIGTEEENRPQRRKKEYEKDRGEEACPA